MKVLKGDHEDVPTWLNDVIVTISQDIGERLTAGTDISMLSLGRKRLADRAECCLSYQIY